MLPESDWPRLCNRVGPVRAGVSDSAFGVAIGSVAVCCEVVTGVVAPNLSHGLGEPRDSAGADNGVGRVEVVMLVVADRGVVIEAEVRAGVNGVRVLGESSVRADLVADSGCVSLDLRRLSDSCRANRGSGPVCVGIVNGARSFGESGCFKAEGVYFFTFSEGRVASAFSSISSLTHATGSKKWRWRQELTGELMDRSCNAGRPGIVATSGEWYAYDAGVIVRLTRIHRNLLDSGHRT